MKISGNTIFIPGSTSGIGLALAVALQRKGNNVIIGGRRQELLDSITAEHPGLGSVRIDTSDPDSINAAAQQVIRDYPDLNVVIAMAGIMNVEVWHQSQGFLESAEAVVTTNVLGPIRLIAAFIEHLQTKPAATVMTVSSGLAFAPLALTPTYNASKAAVHMLTESLRLQFASSTVEFTELVPPAVATDLLPGQRESASAMPLDEFIDEVLGIIEHRPDAREINVERVKFLRYGEARGDYDAVVQALNSAHP